MLYKESASTTPRGIVHGGEKVALTSFQQETDALRIVDLDPVTAGQGMQQCCLSCNGAISQSDENRVTLQKAGRKIIHPSTRQPNTGRNSPSPSSRHALSP